MIGSHKGVSFAPTFSDFAVENFEVVSDHKTYGNDKKKLDSSIFELAQGN